MATPKIRLKGFEGEWKEIQSGSLFQPLKNNSLPRAELSDFGFIMNIHYGDVLIKFCECVETAKERIPFIAKQEIAESLYKACPIKNGDIIFADAAEDETVGKCIEIIADEQEKILSGLHTIACRPNIKFATGYLGYYLNSPAFHDQLLPQIQGTKISSISRKAINNSLICYPSFNEQSAIASYFQSLDSLIQTTAKKIESLKQMKAASLISMFPQEGETTPKVRFKGFEGEWKNVSAENIFETYNERNRPDLPVLSANQDIRGMAPRTDTGYNISHNKANEVTYKVVKPGQFVIHLRSFQGGFAHSSTLGITSPAYTVFGFKQNERQDDYFWKIIFMSKEFIKRLETITYGIRDGRSISFEEFCSMKFLVPQYEEQVKISAFFIKIENHLALHAQRLEKLKNIKSECLNKMFV